LKLIDSAEDMFQGAKIYMQIFQSGLIFLLDLIVKVQFKGLAIQNTLVFSCFFNPAEYSTRFAFLLLFFIGNSRCAIARLFQGFCFYATISIPQSLAQDIKI